MARLSVWIEAARPKTLAAAFVPVAVGGAMAYAQNSFLLLPTLVALFCAFAIQVATNFANDYFDNKKGADTHDRIGFKRASASGLISEKAMLFAISITFLVAFLAGLYLVWHGGWIILAIGILSILFGVLYTGGPFPLAYNGLGDIFVLIFFGIIAVTGTYYLNTLSWDFYALPASLAVGALAVNILVVNNLRDSETDAKVNKRTLGVIFGDQFLRFEYTIMIILAFSVPVFYLIDSNLSYGILLPFLSLPLFISLLRSVWTESEKRQLNDTLEQTAKAMTLFGILLCAGFIIA